MKNDLATVIRRVGSFLGSPVSEDNIPTLVDHLSFDKMKKNTAVNKEDFVEVHTYKSKICNIDFFFRFYMPVDIDYNCYVGFFQASQASFEEVNKGEKVAFMRKGQVGDWVNHFTPELEKRFDEWEKRSLKGSDLKFQYQL